MNDFHESPLELDIYDRYPKQYPERLDLLINMLAQIEITREQVLQIVEYRDTIPHLTENGFQKSEYLLLILRILRELNQSMIPRPKNEFRWLEHEIQEWILGSKWTKREEDPILAQYKTPKDIILSGNFEHIRAATNILLNLYYGDFS